MIIFIGGPHAEAAAKKLKETLSVFDKDRNKKINIFEFEAKNNFAEFKSVFETMSIFSPSKVVVLKNLFGKDAAKFKEDLFEWAENKNIQKNTEHILVIFEKGALDKKDLDKINKISQENDYFDIPEGAELKKWIIAELDGVKINPRPELVDGLCHLSDLPTIKNEIEKMACFMAGKEHVSGDKIKHQIEFSSKNDDKEIFTLMESILSGKKDLAIKIIHKQLRSGKNEQMILGAMHYQIKNLLKIKRMSDRGLSPDDISQRTGLPKFVVDKNRRLLAGTDFRKLKSAQELIFKCDLKIKSGRIEPKLALEMLASEI